MKRIALVLLGVALSTPAMAYEYGYRRYGGESTSRFYDNSGRLTGRGESRGDGVTRFYDSTGRPAGRAETRGDGVTRFYDTTGRLVGRGERRR